MSQSDPKAAIADRFLDSLLKELVLETALTTHATIKRARSICKHCGTRCRSHTPAAAANGTASSSVIADDGASRSTSGTPNSSASASQKTDYYSNNPLFECLVCSRQVSSNRYATHLAKCMGMGSKGGRKGASRSAKASVQGNATYNRFGTPKYSSDLDDDTFVKKSKLKNGANGDKRAPSPFSASSVRINKKIKTSSPTPPPPDQHAGGMMRSHSSQPFAPSGLSTSTVLSGSPLNPLNKKRSNRAESESACREEDLKLHASKQKGRLSALGSNNSTKRKREDDDVGTDEDQDGETSFKDVVSIASGSEDGDSDAVDEEEGELSEDDIASAAGGRIKGVTNGISNGSDDDEYDDDESTSVLADSRRPSDAALAGGFGNAGRHKKSSSGVGGLQRERGSDGEFIDVESASEQSDNDSF